MNPNNWRRKAACAGKDGDLFYAGEREPKAVQEARGICNTCLVRTACLTAAYVEGDEWSIRAGTTPRQRNAYLRKADGKVAGAVVEALETTAVLLRNLYRQHVEPAEGGHMVWTDDRQWINVRGTPYTVHRIAWVAFYGVDPIGHVKRSCGVEGCVAQGCLTDRWMRELAEKQAEKQAAA
jgi:hypothetical protein